MNSFLSEMPDTLEENFYYNFNFCENFMIPSKANPSLSHSDLAILTFLVYGVTTLSGYTNAALLGPSHPSMGSRVDDHKLAYNRN